MRLNKKECRCIFKRSSYLIKGPFRFMPLSKPFTTRTLNNKRCYQSNIETHRQRVLKQAAQPTDRQDVVI